MSRQGARGGGTEAERARLAAVHRYDILDAPRDGSFDRIAIAAAKALKTPIATVTMVDEDRVWLSGRLGVEAQEVTRGPGLCVSAILTDDVTVLADAAVDPEALNNPLVRGEFGLRFYAAAPIITRDGYRLGTVNVMDTKPRRIDEEESEVLRSLADVVADHLELRLSARRALHLERQLVEQAKMDKLRAEREAQILLKSLLPPSLPDIPGVDLACDYRPVVKGCLAGDFYDVFPAGDGRWGIILGDVMGKGTEAGAVAALVRNSLKTALVAGHSCDEALSILNGLLLPVRGRDDEIQFCTALCATLEPLEDFLLRVSSGGHPAPLVLAGNGEVKSVATDGPLIGVFASAQFTSKETTLDPGDAVVFYTDGITEMTVDGEMFGEDGIKRQLAAAKGASAEELVRRLTDHLSRPDASRRDDVALLISSVRRS